MGWKSKPKKEEEQVTVKLSAIDQDILTTFSGGRELYGLQVLDELNLGRATELSFGSLYPALNRLEKKGLLSWRWGDEQEVSGGARRKYYRITSLGSTTLREVEQYRDALAARAVQNSTAWGGA